MVLDVARIKGRCQDDHFLRTAMVERELYTRSKTAPTEEEREKARQEYLDRRGIPEDFRW